MKKVIHVVLLLLSVFVTSQSFAQSGTYLILDGSTGFVQIADHSDLDIDSAEDITISMWVQSDDVSKYHRIIDKRDGDGTGYQLISEISSGAFASAANNNLGVGQGSSAFSNTAILDGLWHHIAMVHNVSNNTNKVFVDGVLQAECTKTDAGIGTSSLANSVDLYFGLSPLNNDYFPGNIDEVRYWSYAMSETDLVLDMNMVLTGSEANLLAAWDFENVLDTDVPDISGNGHQGTMNGNAIAFDPNQDQILTFDPIPQKYTTDPPFTVSASVNTGLPITYSILSGPATISGDLLTLTGEAGIVEVQAEQVGEGSFLPIAQSHSFEVVDLGMINPEVGSNLVGTYPIEMPESIAYPLYANATIEEGEFLSISSIEFEVNETIIPAIDQNGYFLAWWTPLEEGEYSIISKATASNGNTDADTTIVNVVFDANSQTVQAFDGDLINFDGSAASRWFYGTYEFPQSVGTYESIVANFSVTCPSVSGGCDDWDRLAWVEFKGPNGDWLELFRYITPYGVACSHSIDVTDFASLLQGEVELRMFIDTWGSGGWDLHLDFDYNLGTPEFAYSHVQELWHGNYNFGDPENFQPADTLALKYPYHTQQASIRLTTTGHGWGNNNTSNAAEFYHANHDILVDDVPTFNQDLWNDCNPNPDNCTGQMGTWQYNRAGWCPGTIAPPFVFDLTPHLSLDTFNLAYVFQESYMDNCHPNNPNCVSGQTCADCNDGYNPHYRVGAYLISQSNTPIELALPQAQVLKPFDVGLYPNPSNGFFHLNIDEQMDDFVVTVHDIRGATLKTYFFKDVDELNAFVFNVSTLSKGTYFVKIQNEKQSTATMFNL